MNPISYIIWHYFEAPLEFLKIWKNFLIFFGRRLFPIFLLIKTLFSPWRREAQNYSNMSPDEILRTLSYNLVSRFVGFIVRITLLAAALSSVGLVLVSGIILFAVWILWPILLVLAASTKEFVLLVVLVVFAAPFIMAYSRSRERPADTLSLQEALNQKWSQNIWLRLAFPPGEVPLEVKKDPDNHLVAFLKEKKIKQKDFESALIWEVAKEKTRYIRKRFWLKENLWSVSGVGRNLMYGFTPLIDKYTEQLKSLGNYEDLVGRREELETIERVLAKGKESNILVIGEPGVGKKSLIQKFARLVYAGKSIEALVNKRVVFFNLKGALAGLKTAGELEERLIAIFDQAKKAGDVIMVIDDFHSLASASVDIGLGKKDISQTLIPFLQSGDFQIIAVTTYQGLHQQLEKHSDLMKFFEKVEVKEPDEETTKTICLDKVRELEARSRVIVTIQTISAVVEKSGLYISDLPFPEKALDLLEDVTIYVATKTKEQLVRPEHVDIVLSKQTEIPIGALSETEKEKLLKLEDYIHERVVNQEKAVKEIASAMRRGRLEVSEKKRPIGSFLFLGPTGVGKTETAKALAFIYFGSEDRMNRFDMSEYQGAAAVAKMIGSRERGKPGELTTIVRENPFSLLLLDEIEKADYGVLNLFLQVLDEGWLTDAMGRKTSFRNQIIVATSNAGAEFIREKLQESEAKNEILDEEKLTAALIDHVLKKGVFKPEFLNRFDGVIMFKPLTKEHLLKVSELMLQGLKKRLAKQDLIFNYSSPLVLKMATLGYDPLNGARPMRRVIQKTIEDLIAQKLLKEEIKKEVPFEIKAEEIS